MNRIYLCVFIVFITVECSISYAQDYIYKTDGSDIVAKVIEITLESIKYKNYEQLGGPIRNIMINDVFMILYEDGTREVFKNKKAEDDALKTVEDDEYVIERPNSNVQIEDEMVYYEDELGNNDLILPLDGDEIICIIDRYDRDYIYYHINQVGRDTRGKIHQDKVDSYFDNKFILNPDSIISKEGTYILCNIRRIEEDRIHFVIKRQGPDTISSIPLFEVNRYRRRNLAANY